MKKRKRIPKKCLGREEGGRGVMNKSCSWKWRAKNKYGKIARTKKKKDVRGNENGLRGVWN